MDIQLALLQWSAWAPGLVTEDDWQAWSRGECAIEQEGQPSLDFVPALARRRMSRLTRMAVQVAENCRGDHAGIPTIFATRHGEITRTFSILENIATGVAVSPADFSVSVHNTAAGLYSIYKSDPAASTTISASADTLEMAFIEAAAQLASGTPALLLVMADDPVPAVYDRYIDETEYPYALALRLACASDAVQQAGRQLCLTRHESEDVTTDNLPHGLQLLKLLINGGSSRWGRWAWSTDFPAARK